MYNKCPQSVCRCKIVSAWLWIRHWLSSALGTLHWKWKNTIMLNLWDSKFNNKSFTTYWVTHTIGSGDVQFSSSKPTNKGIQRDRAPYRETLLPEFPTINIHFSSKKASDVDNYVCSIPNKTIQTFLNTGVIIHAFEPQLIMKHLFVQKQLSRAFK